MGQSKLKSCKCGTVDCGQLVNIGVLAQHTSELRTGIPYVTGAESPLTLVQLHTFAGANSLQNTFHNRMPHTCLWFDLDPSELNDAEYPVNPRRKLHAVMLGHHPAYAGGGNRLATSAFAAAKTAMCWFPAPGSAAEEAIDDFLAAGGTVIVNVTLEEYIDNTASPVGKAQLRPSVSAKVTEANAWFAHVGANTRVIYNEDLHTFDTLTHSHGISAYYFQGQYPANGLHKLSPNTCFGADLYNSGVTDFTNILLQRDFRVRNPPGTIPYTYAAPWDVSAVPHPISAGTGFLDGIGNRIATSAFSADWLIGIHNHDYSTYLEQVTYRKFLWDSSTQFPGATHFVYPISTVFGTKYKFQNRTTFLYESQSEVYQIPAIIAEQIETGPGAGGKLFITHCEYGTPLADTLTSAGAGVTFAKFMINSKCRHHTEHIGLLQGVNTNSTDTVSGNMFSVRSTNSSWLYRNCNIINPGVATANNNTTGLWKVFPSRAVGIIEILNRSDSAMDFRTDNALPEDDATQHVLMAIFHGGPFVPTNVLGGVGAELNAHSLTRTTVAAGTVIHEFRVPVGHADIADFVTQQLVRTLGTSGNGTHYTIPALAISQLSGWQNATHQKNTGTFTHAMIQRVGLSTPNGGTLTLIRSGFPNVDVPIVVRPIVYQSGKYLLGVNGEYVRTKSEATLPAVTTQRDGHILSQGVNGWRDVTNWPTLGGLVDLQFGPTAPLMSVGLAAIADVNWGMNTGDTATTRYRFVCTGDELDFAISFPTGAQSAIHSESYDVP